MKDHEIRELINEITKVAQDYSGTQQLRERLVHLLVPVLKEAQAESERLDYLIDRQAYVTSNGRIMTHIRADEFETLYWNVDYPIVRDLIDRARWQSKTEEG